jgi:hypothetical protein
MKWAPLRLYSYDELIDLIHAAKNCPVDVLFQLLEVGGKMVEERNFPDLKSREFIDTIICDLHSRKVYIPCYGSNQSAARDELKRLHSLFSSDIREPAGGHSGKWTTPDIERVVRRQERRASLGLPPMTADEVYTFITNRDSGDSEMFSSPDPMLRLSPTGLKQHLQSRRSSEGDGSVPPRLERGVRDSPSRLEGWASRGRERFRALDEQHRQEISFLAGLFTKWEDAYEASMTVWERMKRDPEFDIDILTSQIQFAFANFLVGAIKQFMLDEGFIS